MMLASQISREQVPMFGNVACQLAVSIYMTCWSQISREQVPMFGSNVACQLAVSIYM